jgi:hypothetical protein
MDDTVAVQCPYCLQWVEFYVEPEVVGHYVEDCEVCCNPWQVVVTRDESGSPQVQVSRAQ